jgi:hypothetical protein
MRRLSIIALLTMAAVLAPGSRAARADSRHIIICGSGGDETYRSKFASWGPRLRRALVDRMGQSSESVVLLMEATEDTSAPARLCDLETIRSVLKEAAGRLTADDDLFLYFIGHGSHWRGVSRFHIPGPDLTSTETAQLLGAVRARRIVVINAASSSAGFINALSRPGRVICTATRSVEERNATEFIEHFIQALEDGSADQNRDERVSVLEACRQAAALTDAAYLGRGLIATEHALLDDNGDGQGVRLAGDAQSDAPDDDSSTGPLRADGGLARECFLKDFTFAPAVPRELVDRYRSLLTRIDDLKRRKAAMDADGYYAALEPLLIEAARTHREIRRIENR